MTEPVLEIRNLVTEFKTPNGVIRAVDGISLKVERGKTLGIVGESGCGKSMLSLSVMGLVPQPGKNAGGEVIFEGQDLLKLSPDEMRRLRGNRIAMIFQEPMTSLNPVHTIGYQLVEAIQAHHKKPYKVMREEAIEALRKVRIPAPERRFVEYPHQLSGGMRQRVMIAMALVCKPVLLIADEPTTALDVTIQAEIVELILELCKARGTAVLMISHDLGLVARMCDRVAVMYAGHIVEQRPASQIFTDPRHPYTRGLVASLPLLGRRLQEGRKKLTEIKGVVPGLLERDEACGFASRCPRATEQCRTLMPPVTALEGISTIRCCHHD